MTTTIEAIKTFIIGDGGAVVGFPGLVGNAEFTIDYQGEVPTSYAIITLPTNPIIQKYIDGSSTRQLAFALQSMESTGDELARIQTSGFYEDFSEWLEAQTEAGNLPVLEAGKTAELIEAVTQGFLYREGESNTGVYQITCRLEFSQVAPTATPAP